MEVSIGTSEKTGFHYLSCGNSGTMMKIRGARRQSGDWKGWGI